MNEYFKKIVTLYERYERPISSFSLFAGFLFDAITLKRVDLFFENIWVIVHLIVAGLGILILNLYDNHAEKKGTISEATRTRVIFWLIVVIQFAFGGLLSTFLVYYFRSASLSVSWPFLLLLVATFICNERFHRHYARLTFQISIFYISLYCFVIFFVPVILHRIGDAVFLLSGAISLVLIFLFGWLLQFFTREKFKQSRHILFVSIGVIFLSINAAYFLNIIPPIPLSLKDGGVYHSITHTSSGNYILTKEKIPFFSRETIHIQPGESVFVYSAIFAPTDLNTKIIHQWQYYDDANRKWITSSTIPLAINGGRDGGFRTYSQKSSVFPGLWRVNVETPSGQIVGRIIFLIQNSPQINQLETVYK